LAAAQKQAGNIVAQSTASVGVPSVNVSINGIRKNLSNGSNNINTHQLSNNVNLTINKTAAKAHIKQVEANITALAAENARLEK